MYEYAAAIRSGEMDWKDVEKADFNTRLKWVGLVHRDKRTPGKFMMRMRVPNGTALTLTMTLTLTLDLDLTLALALALAQTLTLTLTATLTRHHQLRPAALLR